MIYPRLSLKNGGGIVSEQQQAEQDHNVVHLLIGLGGTVIDCIGKIKRQVYERIKPDDSNVGLKMYQHIRFLAVDVDYQNEESWMFAGNEFFDISNPNIRNELKKENGIDHGSEFDWFDQDKMHIEGKGTGGSRVVGRYLLMDRSDLFLAHVKEMIKEGKEGAGAASVYIHVFSGLCGGVGSGCFLDACYLIRQAIEEEAGATTKVFGYFFMPDISLAKIPGSAAGVRDYLEKNGYAAMQELDYCMRIRENGGAFVQNYKGGIQIAWDEAPVDFCCLVGEADGMEQNDQNIYWKTLGSVADYIVDYLTYNGDYRYGLMSGFSCYWNSIFALEGHMEIGCNAAYYTIGTSSARIPFGEINTYLAAKTFETFSVIKDHMPAEKEIEKLAERAKISNIEELLLEITKNAGSDIKTVPDYLDWTFSRDNEEHELIRWYTEQKAERIGIQEKNAKSMQDEKNMDSLIERICKEIDACAVDLNRGPFYAYNISENLQNFVDGLLKELENRINKLEYNMYMRPQSRKEQYEQSRFSWQGDKNKCALFGKPQKAYKVYVMHLEDYIRGQIERDSMEKLENTLINLKKQMKNRAAYYRTLNRMMNNLMDTFSENLSILNTDMENSRVYAMPLVTVEEIRPKLDAAVKNMDMPELFKKFVCGFLDDPRSLYDPEMGAYEDEYKISEKVQKFFVKDAFSPFANRSITEFLTDKYGTTTDVDIMEHLYNDYMVKLIENSKPLFALDKAIWNAKMMAGGIEYITVPNANAEPVIAGARKLAKKYSISYIKYSDYTDQIYMMQRFRGFPISAYKNMKRYEEAYFEETEKIKETRHLYMGKGGSDLFNNWNQLPPITPVSCIKGEIPHKQQKLLDEAQTVYTEAKKMQLIYGDRIRQFTDDTVQKLEEMKVLAANVDVEWEEINALSRLRDVKAKLETSIEIEQLKYQDTEYSLPKGSCATEKIEETVRKDYFVSSPALQTLVRRDLEKVNAVKAEIQKIEKRIELLEG